MRTTGVRAQFLQKLRRRGVLVSVVALSLVFLLTVTVFADTVNIYDQAHVLNGSQIRNAASSLKYPLSIYTANNFNGSPSSFDQRTLSHVTSDNIVIAISTNLHHMAIKSGSNVPLSSAGANGAVNAFISTYASTNDYTAATISSINALKSTLGSAGPGNNTGSGFSIPGISGGCLVGLVILGLLLFFVLRRKRRPGFAGNGGFGNVFNRQRMNPDYPPPYQGNVPPYQNNPPPYQGYNPSNSGPNYSSGYPPQQRGMNPLAAGGLGAAAGGLLGYELGRHQQDEGNRETDSGSSGDFGGGDTSSGSSGDFGGGNTGSGSSGDFGGGDTSSGSSGDFGGGDMGGGSGGNF